MEKLSSFLTGVCSLAGSLLPPNVLRAFCVVVFAIGNIPYAAYFQRSVAAENLGKVIPTITRIIGIPVGMALPGAIAERMGAGSAPARIEQRSFPAKRSRASGAGMVSKDEGN